MVFKQTLIEKQAFLSAKKNTQNSAITRLSQCADILRVVVKAGAPKFKGKTVEAIIDHITQILPTIDGGYCVPLAQHYLKALSAVFEHQSNIERLKHDVWLDVVDFCLQAINLYLDDNDAEPSGALSRSFSGLGTNHVSGSDPKTSVGHGGSHRRGSLTRQNAEDLLQTLLLLVSTSNAPLRERYLEVTDTTMRFLQLQGTSVSQAHQLAFSIVNSMLYFTRTDRVAFSKSIAAAAVPLITRFLQAKTVAKDEMLNSVRDEMLILLFTIYPHLESIVIEEEVPDISLAMEDLSDVLRADYAKRSDRDQIQLDDVKMVNFDTETADTTPFRLYGFQLRPYNLRAERGWANLQAVGMLEHLVSLGDQRRVLLRETDDGDIDQHPSKRQRITSTTDRLLDPLKSEDEKTRLAGLQVLAFILQDYQLSSSSLTALLSQLRKCASDKRGDIASWALLDVARLGLHYVLLIYMAKVS